MGKLSEQTNLSDPNIADFLYALDVSDTTDGPAGSSKKVLVSAVAAIIAGNNFKVINEESDFPTAIANERQLVAKTVYWIGADVSTADKLLGAAGVTIESGANSTVLTYTGVDDFIDVSDTGLMNLNGLSIVCASQGTGKFAIKGVDTTPLTTNLIITNSNMTAKNGISVDNVFQISCDLVALTVEETGIDINSAVSFRSLAKVAVFTSTASSIGIDVTGSTGSTVEFADLLLDGIAGSIGVKGDAGSANVDVNSTGTIEKSNVTGAMTPLDGITTSDIRWEFDRNSPNISDSAKAASAGLPRDAARTVTIGVPGQFEPVNLSSGATDDWSSTLAERFTISADGIVTYIAEIPACFKLDYRLSIGKVGGGANELAAKIFFNDATPLDDSQDFAESSGVSSVSGQIVQELAQNDNFRVKVANLDGLSNILVRSGSFLITEV